MRRLTQTTRDMVYNAPIIHYDTETYTPVTNKYIMDIIETKLHDVGLTIKSQEYKVATSKEGDIKGVIGAYNITTDDGEFGQRIMFRNSYDKSMSFAFCCGTLVWICENGCVSGDYTYKRVHRGVIIEDQSTTERDVITNINDGFKTLQVSFERIAGQVRELKKFELSPNESYDILGNLFFEKKVLSITQMSIIKKEFECSRHFKHLGDPTFTAYDLYNHITESLKVSHPLSYISDHVKTHSLFEEVFSI